MTTWMGQIEIEAGAVLPDGASHLTYTDPRERFRVRLSNLRICPRVETPLLDMQLEFEAADLSAADEMLRPYTREFLYWLSFVASSDYRIHAVKRLVDWTPGVVVRDQLIFHADRSDLPEALLMQELMDTVALFNTHEPAPAVQRAVRWFARGIAAELPDDQFQCFFFAIELLAEHHKPPQPIADKCPACSAELFCRVCNQVPTHVPYARQSIKKLIELVIPTEDPPGETFREFNKVRSRLMHGSQIEELESKLKIPFETLVDRAAVVAHTAIINSLQLPQGEHKVIFVEASTYLHKWPVLKVCAKIGSWGDPNTPRVENLGTLQISVAPASAAEGLNTAPTLNQVTKK
jgi:hypothetical protein